jgi:hypothetical protein
MKVLHNVYGSRQGGRMFNKYLVKKLLSIGFEQSQVDACVFYKGTMMYVLYTDDSILAGPSLDEITATIEEMERVKLEITVEGDLSDFLGVNIDRLLPNSAYHLSQPKLIDSILEEDFRLSGDDVVPKFTPMASSKILSRHPNSRHMITASTTDGLSVSSTFWRSLLGQT